MPCCPAMQSGTTVGLEHGTQNAQNSFLNTMVLLAQKWKLWFLNITLLQFFFYETVCFTTKGTLKYYVMISV